MARPVLIVKVGTNSLLSTHDTPKGTFDTVASSILTLTDRYRVVLVSSGAIGFGMHRMGLSSRPSDLASLQALSMLGQVGLMDRWQAAFGRVPVGQVLVTRRELLRESDRSVFINSISALWEYDAVPVANENDAVATDEISFGDNDRLAAEIAVQLNAVGLILLTDQDGIQCEFGTKNQRCLREATIAEAQAEVTADVSVNGRGGASSKLEAASMALAAGVTTYIARASEPGVIEAALAGELGTKIIQ